MSENSEKQSSGRGELPSMSTPSPGEFAEFDGPPPEIEGYEILDKLGEAGQGQVWRALQLSTKREVALKIPRTGFVNSRHALARFQREIELVARLKHPNIAGIHDSGLYSGVYYYTMDLIRGVHLDEYVKHNNLSQKQIMALIRTICLAVQHAHQNGIIHRDLKPSNIIIDGDGQPFVVDFGLARNITGDGASHTVTFDGQSVGTPAYMSPEQAAGIMDKVDTRSDVYSLGIILYQLLTGTFPFKVSNSMMETLKHIREDEPVKPSSVVSNLNDEIEAIILKAISRDPDHRYQSAVELGNDIQCWLTGRPIVARSDSSLYILWKLIVRNRYATAVVALLLIIILSFSFVSFDLYCTAENERRIAVERQIYLKIEKAKFQEFAQKLTFNLGLAIRYGDPDMERVIADVLNNREVGNQKLGKAFEFLLDKRTVQEKGVGFLEELGQEHLWFAWYIIGEHYLKDGKEAEALDAFENSIGAIGELSPDQPKPEEWIVSQINSRLIQLRN